MRFPRLILSFLVLIPFLFSVSGILVIKSHCSCTGKNNISFYLPPETCSSILDDHHHLFDFHATDLGHCCGHETAHDDCGQDGICHGCGCESPEAQFFKLKNQFTEKKFSELKNIVSNEIVEILLFNHILDRKIEPDNSTRWFKYPPPLIASRSTYIYFICKTKIPEVA